MKKNHPAHERSHEEKLEEKPFLEHLEDLRRTIIKALLVFGCAFLLCVPLTFRGFTVAIFKRPLVHALTRVNESVEAVRLPTLYPAGGFIVAMKISLEVALVISLPFILYCIGDFVLPALTRHERRYFAPVLVAGSLLFYCGIILCYFLTLPWALQFFWKFNSLMGIDNLWTINEYVKFAGRLLIAFGLIFEMPLVILFLVKIGVLDYRILSQKRRYAIVIAFIVAALLTPPDAITQLMMAIPLVALYELCVLGAWLMRGKNVVA